MVGMATLDATLIGALSEREKELRATGQVSEERRVGGYARSWSFGKAARRLRRLEAVGRRRPWMRTVLPKSCRNVGEAWHDQNFPGFRGSTHGLEGESR